MVSKMDDNGRENCFVVGCFVWHYAQPQRGFSILFRSLFGAHGRMKHQADAWGMGAGRVGAWLSAWMQMQMLAGWMVIGRPPIA
jgi:hypothetical protein